MMLLIIALVAAALAGMVVWYTMLREPGASDGRGSTGAAAPDDDPEFLRQLDQRLRHRGDDPT